MNLERIAEYPSLYHIEFNGHRIPKELGPIVGDKRLLLGFYLTSQAIRKGTPETELEEEFLSLLAQADPVFGLIGTCQFRPEQTKKHEIGHFLYDKDRRYKKRVLGVLRNIDQEDIVRYLVDGEEYPCTEIENEVQAWLLADVDELGKLGLVKADQRWAHRKLNMIYRQHIGFNGVYIGNENKRKL